MKGRWSSLLLAGIIVLLTIAIHLPAGFVINRVTTAAGVPVSWQGVEGSVFDIQIYGLGIMLNSGHELYLDRVDIQSSAMALITGKLESTFKITYSSQELSGNSTLEPGRWRINEFTGALTITSLYPAIPELEILGITGDLQVDVEQLSGQYHGSPGQGKIRVRINELETRVVNIDKPLGSYMINVDNFSADNISASINNLPGDNLLLINGLALFTKGTRELQLDGQAWLSEGANPSLAELLLLMGRYENNRVLIDWKLPLR